MTGSQITTETIPTILVVDDEPEVRALLLDVLGGHAYVVHAAVDGAAALKCVVEDRPDLVLLDVDMPRLRGVETLIAILELSPQTKVVMISGKADATEARRALALGAFDYVMKPFDLAYLDRVIQTAILGVAVV